MKRHTVGVRTTKQGYQKSQLAVRTGTAHSKVGQTRGKTRSVYQNPNGNRGKQQNRAERQRRKERERATQSEQGVKTGAIVSLGSPKTNNNPKKNTRGDTALKTSVACKWTTKSSFPVRVVLQRGHLRINGLIQNAARFLFWRPSDSCTVDNFGSHGEWLP